MAEISGLLGKLYCNQGNKSLALEYFDLAIDKAAQNEDTSV